MLRHGWFREMAPGATIYATGDSSTSQFVRDCATLAAVVGAEAAGAGRGAS